VSASRPSQPARAERESAAIALSSNFAL
jgi:hypothetical protein